MKPAYRLLSLATLSLALVGCTTSQTLLHQVGVAPLPDRVAQKLYGHPPSTYYNPSQYRPYAPNYTGVSYTSSQKRPIPHVTGVVPGAETLPPPEDPNFPQAFERLMREDDAQFAANQGIQPMWGNSPRQPTSTRPVIVNQTTSGYSALGY